MLLKAGINERQLKAVLYLKKYKIITNKDYRKLCGVSERTGTRDLMELVKKKILKQKGKKGAGANYVLG